MTTESAGGPIGQPLPDVTLPTLDGAPLRLRDLLGKRVLRFCWASW